MTKYILMISCALFLWSCFGKSNSTAENDLVDSTATEVDTLVSDVNWGDEEDYYEEEVEETPKKRRSSGHSSGGGGAAADSDADVIKYQNYQRMGDTPNDFAKALIYPAIRMVYSDNFAKPKASVVNSTQDGDRYTIDLVITWKDHWVPTYEISGTLEVNSDGSDAKFAITDKNVEAEVLELTEDNFESTISIPSL